MPLASANSASPQAIVHYFQDAAGNAQQAQASLPYPIQHSAGYTLVGTAGTTTAKATAGVFYGAMVTVAGTNSTFALVDGTNTLIPATNNTAVGGVTSGLPSGVGVRCATSVLIVTAGTAVSTTAYLFA